MGKKRKQRDYLHGLFEGADNKHTYRDIGSNDDRHDVKNKIIKLSFET